MEVSMTQKQPAALLASILVVWICSAAGPSGQRAGAAYQAVKVCPLVSVAEVKKIAPWAPQLDQFATAEEETVGASGSSCNYPTVLVQVLEYRPQTIDTLRKSGPLETVAGIGEEAYARDNRGKFAEVVARVGPHLLTVQFDIGTNQTYATAKPTAIELAKLFASRLR
jgi:hypothetical protein